MSIGGSLFLVAVGAILRYAVTRDKITGIDIETAGLILMLVGALAFVLALYFTFVRGDRVDRVEVRDRIREPVDPRY